MDQLSHESSCHHESGHGYLDHKDEYLRRLKRMGFSNPPQVSQTIRGWHHGRMPATRSARARELLTALKPALLSALARTADPDTAFARFSNSGKRCGPNFPAGRCRIQSSQVFFMMVCLLHLSIKKRPTGR